MKKQRCLVLLWCLMVAFVVICGVWWSQRTKIKVSVVVPVYNAQNYLAKCLDSLMAQTLKDIEIIAVNDGSTDGSLDILNKYAKKDKRIKVYSQKNQGVGIARNLGIEKAQGEYVGFVDSDDRVNEVFYENLYNTAKKEKSEVSATPFLFYSNSNYLETRPWFWRTFRQEEYTGTSFFAMLTHGGTVQWDKIYKRDFLKKYHILCTVHRSFKEDIYFTALVMMYAKKVAIARGAIYYYTVLNDSKSHQKRDIIDFGLIEMFKDLGKASETLSGDKKRKWDGMLRDIRLWAMKDELLMLNASGNDVIFEKKYLEAFPEDIYSINR